MQKHTPRKRFGQNFLQDRQVIGQILDAIQPAPSDIVVEIGPGLGALTDPLLQAVPQLHVVEIDNDIVARLESRYPAERLVIHHADALKFDFSPIAPHFRIVGNLPYNISTPLLFHLSQFSDQIVDMHFMLQKEVVERMVAAPSTSDYGRLSVMLQYRFQMEYLFTVPPGAFYPAPKVESAVVRMDPLYAPTHRALDEPLFADVVSAAFAQRRKTLRNTIRQYLDGDELAALGIDPGQRAENLAVADFVNIANYLSRKRGPAS